MLEQEIKILNIDTEELIPKLLQHHAKRIFSGFITDTTFVHESKKLDFTIRVRKKNAMRYLTFKKRLIHDEFKQALEIEARLYDPEGFLLKLQEQGFVATKIKQKMRVSYQIGETLFEIDCYEGIPPLLEIESPHAVLIKFWIQELCLSSKQQLQCGNKGLMKFYGKTEKKPHLASQN